jgi:hypothetical protein
MPHHCHKNFFSVLAAAALLLSARAADKEESPSAVPTTAPPQLVRVEDLPFPVGEVIDYTIYWSFVPVGQARVSFEWTEENGRKLVAIRSTAKTNKVVEKLYAVNDVMESVMDPATLLPLRYTKKLSEGRYRTHEVTTFDHAARVAHFESKKSGEKKVIPIAADTRDVLSMMYFLRSQSFVNGATNEFQCMADDKLYNFAAVIGENEKVKVGAYGKVPSVKMEPLAAFDGLFIRKGRIWFWVARDRRQLATKLAASVSVGSISIELEKVSGPGADFWVKPPEGEQKK